MKSLPTLLSFVAAVFFALPARAAESVPASPPEKTAPNPKSAPAANPGAPASGAQKMAADFGKQRDDRLDQRKALLERLRTAKTEEEKQRILSELRQQQQQRIDQQRELARQIREQLQNRRHETRPAAAPGP